MATIETLFLANGLVAAGIVYLDFLRPESLRLLSAFSLAYFYSAVLPVAVYIAGGQIYTGIDPRYIPDALFLSLLCLGGLLAVKIVAQFGARAAVPPAGQPEGPGKISTIVSVIVFSSVLFISAYNIDVFFLPKSQGSGALSALHYKTLLLASVFFCVFVSLYWKTGGLAAYGFVALALYCIVFKERDFFLAGLFMALVLYSQSKIGVRSILVIAIFALSAFSYLSIGRSAAFEKFDFLTIANQGSNLFVNTFVMRYFENVRYEDYYWGYTYFSSLIDTMTFGYAPFRPTLANWLAEEYAGLWTTGGYGFSIEAEAFMNFGYFGVFALFVGIGVFLLKVEGLAMRGYRSGRLMLGWSVMFLMYGIRGESLNIFKSLLLVVIIAAALRIFDTQFVASGEATRAKPLRTLERR